MCAQRQSLRSGCPRVNDAQCCPRSASRGCWLTDSRPEDSQPGSEGRGGRVCLCPSPERRSRLPPLLHRAPPGALGWDLRRILWEPAQGTELQKGRTGCDWWSPRVPRADFSPTWHPCLGWSQAWEANPGSWWDWGRWFMTWGQSGYLLLRECPTPGPQRRNPASQPLTPDPEAGLGFQVNACSPPSGATRSCTHGFTTRLPCCTCGSPKWGLRPRGGRSLDVCG